VANFDINDCLKLAAQNSQEVLGMCLPIRKTVVPILSVITLLTLCTFFATAQDANALNALTDMSQLSTSAQQQIRELIADKKNRTATQRKVGSSLLYAAKARHGLAITPSVKSLKPIFPERPDGRFDVQIRGNVSKALVIAIQKAGGEVLDGRIGGAQVHALLPLDSVELLAKRPDVRGIHETMPYMTQNYISRGRGSEAVRIPLSDAVRRLQSKNQAKPPLAFEEGTGSVTSEGVAAHKVDQALHFYGLTGAGVKIGVLSSSDDFKRQSIASGDLPPDTVTVPGQSGRPGSGEGTAMMEIVHDVAPGAKLFFATANNGPESFAENIRTLRFTYGCDIIVDDVIYYFESPYQDDIIAHAVKDVIADGALYFSSAGNQGHFDDGTSGTWEGDFKAAKTSIPVLDGLGTVHDFGKGVVSNRIEVGGGPLILHWSDPGSLDNPKAADDYDLYILDSTLSNVAVASTDTQNGDDIPFEFLGFLIPPEFRVVVLKFSGTDRAVRVQLFGGELSIATSGNSYGHNSEADAYGVAAVDAFTAGGGAFTGGNDNPVELFSSDGNRRVFFDSDGVPYTPGNYLFKTHGGQVRKKPDLAAADGVSTTLPAENFLNPFFGTSAAAPHAAAIAGLLKQAQPTASAAKIRNALTKTALDIEVAGVDRDSGAGIIDAFAALKKVGAKPSPFIELGSVTAAPSTGDGDSAIEPGESATLITELVNIGGVAPVSLSGTLTTSTPHVIINNDFSAFPSLSPLGGTGVNNVPFSFTLGRNASCGVAPEFNLAAGYNNGPLSPQTVTFRVPTGKPGNTAIKTSYSGPVVPIPDADTSGTTISLPVSGVGAVSNLVFSIDGTACSATEGSTSVGLDHSWVGDIILSLTSPSGTTVVLINRAGGVLNSGNNFCQTVLDDSATDSIQEITPDGAPYTGTFQPANPLSAFVGENANGTWQVHVSDNALFDTGSLRAFSLVMKSFSCD
jgi:subtilisin-like proprotein convertase family protein